jgi:hypothetical protein
VVKEDILDLSGAARMISRYIVNLPFEAQVALLMTADRFDCERIERDITIVFEDLADLCPFSLLKQSSDANAVAPARIAIASLPEIANDSWPYSRKLSANNSIDDWWSAITPLRATWQIELTRLYWEGGRQLVDRPGEQRPLKANGKVVPREREEALHQTRRTYVQIAREFDPR